MCHELALRGLRFERQPSVPVQYKNVHLDCGYRADLVVEDRVLVELKTVERLVPLHTAQASTYLRVADLEVALLVNFNVDSLRQGIRRISRKSPQPSPISSNSQTSL